MSFTIRLATRDDEAGIQAAIKAVYDEYDFPWYPEEYHADLYDLDTHYVKNDFPFWVAEIDGTVVGTGVLALHPLIVGKDSNSETVLLDDAVRVSGTDCSTERLYVHPNARRRGIARSLMQAITDEARVRGCVAMEVWTDKRFEEAHKLYLNLGAKMVGERLCHDPEQSPEYGLILPLT